MSVLIRRFRGKVRRTLASRFRRRKMHIDSPVPIVSFTFDDAPRTALGTGARVLEQHGVRGTYYLSLGLLERTSEIGAIATLEDVERAVAMGHELGCHTFDHVDAWDTDASSYLASVDRNRRALLECLPDQALRSFAYPKNGATLAVKSGLERRFDCCRGGGQTINTGTVDLNLLSACFVDRRARVDLHFVRSLIDRNAAERGWLILAAHDISEEAADFSCPTGLFEAIVRHALDSGAHLLPVAAACEQLRSVEGLSRVPGMGRSPD